MRSLIKKLCSNNSLLLLIFLIVIANSQICHYSCKNCTASSYSNCFSCSDSSFTFTVTQSTQFINSIYLKSIYDVGICVGKVPTGVNSLGVILLIFGLLCLIFFRNFQVFYIYCTIQTLGLFSLIQIAWLSPANYILQSFQYLMPINLILSNLKNQDYMLLIFGYFRLNKYMIDLQITLAVILFVLNIIIFTLIIFFWKMSREKQQQLDQEKMEMTESQIYQPQTQKSQKQQGQHQQNTKQKSVFYTYFHKLFPIEQLLTWKNALHISLYLFFLIIQETMLTIMIQVVFQTGIFIIALWVVYFFLIFVSLLISFNQWDKQKKQEMALFLSIPCMIINWFKKIILPIVIVLPIWSQIIIFILYPLLALLQAYFDSRSKKYGCVSRMFVYKLIQTVLIIALLIYYVNQAKGQNYSNSLKVAIAVFVLSLIFMLIFLVQVPIGIISIITSVAAQNQNKNQVQLEKQNFGEQLNKQDTIDMENIFQPEKQRPTLQIMDMEAEQVIDQKPKQQIYISPKNIKLPKLDNEPKITNTFQIKPNYNAQENILQTKLIQVKAKFSQMPKEQQKKSKQTQKEQQQKQKQIANKWQIKNNQLDKEQNKSQQLQKKILNINQPSNKTIDTINVDENQENNTQKKIIEKIQEDQQIDINDKKDSIQREQNNQKIDEKDEQDQSKKQKKKKRRIIQDPQLRKRYGIK